jgi:predicted SprT family Zn-dependent metalloprotease
MCIIIKTNEDIVIASKKPTTVAHAELQHAFVFFNSRLFQSQLPDALITLQRKNPRCLGYFSANRFGNARVSDTVDEIAMNPQYFRSRPVIETLQTLVHEMVHMWQELHGQRKSAKSYHNAEWGAKMEAVGLMPSNTGKPGGKRTGQQMMDYVIAGGAFEQAAGELIEGGWRPTYYDREELNIADGGKPAEADGTGGEGEDAEPATKSGKRKKFACPGCAGNAWARGAIKLICGDCMEVMV